ncbi:short-chain fatty acids transporter [Thalassobacillus cyri]|uniref:Short-chain fatty acids transporter n=1 Tax=Thalassobacillus cyri TaxID=571932 RepID=A0A1H4E3L8_9BACI|nr:TIGR00366 family protein [Thalassobacillus cyri]SEA78982.1 short-chain fatty acids transporter [Thalassobacillus cyri]
MEETAKKVELQNPQERVSNNPISMLAMFFAKVAEKWLPDAFVFAVILTLIAFGSGIVLTESSPLDMVVYWGDGFWSLLTFTAQIITTFVMSYALALTKPVSKLLEKTASRCTSPKSAIFVVTFSSLIASLISWALGLVVAGIMARLVGKKVPEVDYRVLVAAGYSGFVIWEGGLSSSPSLFVATEGHNFQDLVGIIPTSDTLFSVMNIVLVLLIFFTLPFVMYLIHPKRPEDRMQVDPSIIKETNISHDQIKAEKLNPNEKMDNSRLTVLAGGLLGLLYLGYQFYLNGFSLDLNIVNMMFLTAALLLYGNVKELGNGIKSASGSVGQFALQYPFYAGIMGMLSASGLAVWLSTNIASVANADTLPFFSFLSAGLLNMFIPSGGGQWAVQAPIMLPTAVEMGVNPAKIVTAVAWGDAWTNMIQPFWAIPMLAIAGLRIRDMMGFATITLLYTGTIMTIVLLVF